MTEAVSAASSDSRLDATDDSWIRKGTRTFRHANLALFAAGVSTFGLLYCVQPLMPEFSRSYGVSEAQAALSLSVTTGVLAITMLFMSSVSDRFGRKRIMSWSLLVSALLVLASAFAPNWTTLLLLRTLLGVSLSGLPSIAMTWLSEEMHVDSIGLGMGLFISGNTIGGVTGRIVAGVSADWFGWHVALALVAAVGLASAIMFFYLLPESRHFKTKSFRPNIFVRRLRMAFSDQALPWLYALAFMLMGAFVTVYNYLGYRLLVDPYNLSQAIVGLIFVVYFAGTFSSTWMGSLAIRFGRRQIMLVSVLLQFLGLILTVVASLWLILLGLVIFTFGFFGAHSIASSWVGRRGGEVKAQASSIYLFSYYMGSSVVGALGGLFYASHAWLGISWFVGLTLAIGILIVARLYFIAPMDERSFG